MTVPYRRWLSFDLGMLEGFYVGAGDSPTDWTLLNLGRYICKLGMSKESISADRYWHSVFRPRRGLGFERLDGMDEIVDVTWAIGLFRQHLYSECNVTQFDVIQGFMDNDNPWHFQRVTGRYYDGESEWDTYPPGQIPGYNNSTIVISDPWRFSHILPVMHSWKAGGGNGVEANRYMNDFFRNCAHFVLDNYAPALSAGKRCRIILHPDYMDVRYFNPVVNECRVNDVVQYWVPINTGVEFKLIGMGFNNDDDELDNDPNSDGGGDSRGGGWGDLVDVIEFWKQQDASRAQWRDDFEGGAIEDDWTTKNTDANRTIVQLGGVLTISIAAGTDGRWYWVNNTAPTLYQDFPDGMTLPVEFITKVNNFVLNNKVQGGIFIGYHDAYFGHPQSHDAYLFGHHRADAGEGTGIRVRQATTGGSSTVASPGMPTWFKIKVDENEVISFWYSADGDNWTQQLTFVGGNWIPYEISGFYSSDMQIGVFAQSLEAAAAADIIVPFEYFEINWGGSPYETLVRADGDFTVDTNLQITIPSNKFPLLEEGSYIMRLIKENMDFSPRNSSVDVWGWAGDWRCTVGGLVSEGERIVIESRTGPIFRYPREKRGSILLVEADKQHKGTFAISKEYWAENDVRAPDKFYEGIILEASGFKRGLDDKTGMFKTADMTLKLSNYKKKFSELLNTYDLKNQLVRMYHVFINEPESWKTHMVTMAVEDYNIEGTSFELIMKDASQKYFRGDVPQDVCIKGDEADQFPNLHDDFVGGYAMPDILGMAQLTEGELKGAVQAIYVDTTNYKYLASGGRLHSITEVYADNVLVSASLYEVIYENDHTFIIFDGDQGDVTITFNCTGYMYEGWNSANGYIQNPAWILAYYLIRILSVPLFLLDYAAFTALANIYIAMGEEESGKLILQDQRGSTEVLRELCFSFGAKCWIAKDGSFAVGRKTLTGISSDIVIFEQTDLLTPVRRTMGMKDFITRLSGHFDYIPFHRIFLDAEEQNRDDLEDRFGEGREDRIIGRRPLKDRRW